MDNSLALVLMAVILVVQLAIRVPVAFALLLTGVFGVWYLQGDQVASSVLARVPYETPASYTLVILPMFIAMGVMAKRGGVAEDGFALAARLTRRLPGGLAIGAVMACAAFASVSGSSVATVATLGPIATREMRRHGYDMIIAAGVVGAAGTLGVLIPPSIVLVLYGILTGESIGGLLLAGIIPGILTALLYSAALAFRAWRHPELMGGEGPDLPIRDLALQTVNPVNIFKLVALFVVVMGGIYSGLATPTEAAALGAGLALLFYAYDLIRMRGGGRLADIRDAFGESTRLTGMSLALLIGGGVFTYALVVARLPSNFAQWIEGLAYPPFVVVLIILLGFILLGMFIDGLSILLIAVPLAYPAVTAVGYDGIWFGIVVVKAIEIGLITPPFGMNAFVVAGTTRGLSVADAFRGILWFLPLEIAMLGLLFLVPEIATWLPSMSAGD